MKVQLTQDQLNKLMPYCRAIERSPTSVIKEFLNNLPDLTKPENIALLKQLKSKV